MSLLCWALLAVAGLGPWKGRQGDTPPCLRVELLDGDGQPIATSFVSVLVIDEQGIERLPVSRGGAFELCALPPGTYWAAADGIGFQQTTVRFEYEGKPLDIAVRLPPRHTLWVEVESSIAADAMEAWDLAAFAGSEPLTTGTLAQPQGMPTGMAADLALAGQSTFYPQRTNGGAMPKTVLGLLEHDQSYPIKVSLLAGEQVVATKDVGENSKSVAFDIPRDFLEQTGQLSVSVPAPPKTASVGLYSRGRLLAVRLNGASDDPVLFECVPRGIYLVDVRVSGHSGLQKTVEIRGGEVTQCAIDPSLAEVKVGIQLLRDGIPCPGEVHWRRDGDDPSLPPQRMRVGSDGIATAFLHRGRYAFSARASASMGVPLEASIVYQEIGAAAESAIVLALQAPGAVVLPAEASGTVRVVDSTGAVREHVRLQGFPRRVVLPAGDFVATMVRADGEPIHRQFVVRCGETTAIDWQ